MDCRDSVASRSKQIAVLDLGALATSSIYQHI